MPAASKDGLTTGFILPDGQPWLYLRRVHVAATAWLVLAAKGINPFWMNLPSQPPDSGSSAPKDTRISGTTTTTTATRPPALQVSPFAAVWIYPNPFYPRSQRFLLEKATGKRLSLKTTSFCFTLNVTGHVYVSLFSSKGFLGRMYARPYFANGRMFNRYLGPGRYYVGWTGGLNGRLLPAGTYGYILTASNGKLARTYRGTVTLR